MIAITNTIILPISSKHPKLPLLVINLISIFKMNCRPELVSGSNTEMLKQIQHDAMRKILSYIK